MWKKKKDEILKSLQKFKIKIFNNDNGTKISTKCVLVSPRSLCLSCTFILLSKELVLAESIEMNATVAGLVPVYTLQTGVRIWMFIGRFAYKMQAEVSYSS